MPDTPRAGTRGFRAPEVLARYRKEDQTVAIDVWSAGVVLLCILSRRYPFFSGKNDIHGIAEIMYWCGNNLENKLFWRVNKKKVNKISLYCEWHMSKDEKCPISYICGQSHSRFFPPQPPDWATYCAQSCALYNNRKEKKRKKSRKQILPEKKCDQNVSGLEEKDVRTEHTNTQVSSNIVDSSDSSNHSSPQTSLSNLPSRHSLTHSSSVKKKKQENISIWPEEAFHLLRRCLELDPTKRISAKEALQHPFFKL